MKQKKQENSFEKSLNFLEFLTFAGAGVLGAIIFSYGFLIVRNGYKEGIIFAIGGIILNYLCFNIATQIEIKHFK